jgi:6,7-dimethyl-8-ribityllumazine synthase
MATTLKNLSDNNLSGIKNAGSFKIAIIVSEWNEEVTEALYAGAVSTLKSSGMSAPAIVRYDVPGVFELALAAQWTAAREEIDAVICLGCVIQGETRHFDFICQASADGITNVGLKYDKPIIFGVLTPNTQKQALDRAGGKHGNKGDEAAAAALKMLQLKQQIK